MGILIVLLKTKKNLQNMVWFERIFCSHLLVAYLYPFQRLFSFLSQTIFMVFCHFKECFFTNDILNAAIPFNITGYFVIALIWGLGEGLFYVVLSDKIKFHL